MRPDGKKPDQINNFFTPIIVAGGRIAGLAAIVIMLLTTVDVFLRYFINSPILGGMEIVENLMLVLCFFAIPFTGLQRRHVKVDILVMHFKPLKQMVIKIFVCILSLALLLTMTINYIPEAMEVLKNGEASEILFIPEFPFYVIIFLSFLFSSIVVISELVKTIQTIRKKEYEF